MSRRRVAAVQETDGARLTPAELDVLERLATGASLHQVAHQRGTAYQTTKTQIDMARQKLGVETTLEALLCLGLLVKP